MAASATTTRVVYGSAEPRLHGVLLVRSIRLDDVMLWLLSAFAFILPTDLRLSGGKSIAMRLGYACLLLGIAGLVRRKAFVLPRGGFWWLMGFVAWSSCSLVWARYPADAQHKVLLYGAMFAATAIIPQYAWNARVRARLIDAYLAGCGLGIIGTVANFLLGSPYPELGYMDVDTRYSFGSDPNYLALSLVIGIPLALYRSRQYSAHWRRALAWLYVPAALVTVFLTGSRTALMAFLVAIVAYSLLTGGRATRWIFAGAVLCVVVGALMPVQISERFAGIPDELRYGTLSDRRQLWDRGAAIVAEHPFQGIGAGASAGAWDIAAHNTPLELMMEGGLVSLSLFYGALLLGIRAAWRREDKEARTLIAVWLAWFVGTLLLSWENNIITWFMFAMLFSASSAQAADRLHAPLEVAEASPQGIEKD